jgi:thiamine monophosphate kinase
MGTTLFLKNRARPGDVIWVSGSLGSVAAALDGLKSKTMNETWNKWAKKKIITPSLPLSKSRKISKTRKINAGTDLSDGLCADLFSLCTASKVGAIIEVDKIPVERQVKAIAEKRNLESWKYALTIGGDFQFIVTANVDQNLNKFGFQKIGRILKKKKINLKIDNKYHQMPTTGHRDFEIVNFKHEVDSLINNLKFKS